MSLRSSSPHAVVSTRDGDHVQLSSL